MPPVGAPRQIPSVTKLTPGAPPTVVPEMRKQQQVKGSNQKSKKTGKQPKKS